MKVTLDYARIQDESVRPGFGEVRTALSGNLFSPQSATGEQRGDSPASNSLTLDEVRTYYNDKTARILKRYGPGPRVHYHTGFGDELEPSDVPAEALRRRLVSGQERILEHAAQTWDAATYLSGEVLDVGCGLGGGSLFWAQKFGASVTAVTCVPAHVKLVREFAEMVGVASRVQPVVADVLELDGRNCFDAAVAVDSSCHLPRREWFQRLAELLRPNGRVFISDCLLGRPEYEDSFNRYWRARIGTVAEYLEAARAAGFEPLVVDNLSSRVRDFFATIEALVKLEARAAGSDAAEAERCAGSLRQHRNLHQGLGNGGYVYVQMSLVKKR